MAMRDFFKGSRDRDNDRWREQWRDDRYPQRYSSGSNFRSRDRDFSDRDDYRTQRGPQFYGQSGRADWAGQNESSRRQPSRDQGERMENRDYGSHEYDRAENHRSSGQYHGGFYAGETGRESMYRTEPSAQGDWGRDSQRWNDDAWNRTGDRQSGGRDDWRPFESSAQSQFQGEHRGRGPKGYQRSDQRIHEDVCECLTDDHFIDASNIEITVQGGIVTLTGTVGSRNEKRRAEDLIENLSGVKDVNNSLRVGEADSRQRSENTQFASRQAANEQTSRH